MKVLQWLRKGFGYVLMSMGASSPQALKRKPEQASAPKPGPRS